MPQPWYDAPDWNDADTDEPDAPTHRCRVCDHAARIQTPQRRTEHFCRECDAFQRFVSVVDDEA